MRASPSLPPARSFGQGDVVGCLLDCGGAAGSVAFTKNGRPMGEAFKLPPNVHSQVGRGKGCRTRALGLAAGPVQACTVKRSAHI